MKNQPGFLVTPKNPDVIIDAIIYFVKNKGKSEKMVLRKKGKGVEMFYC